MKINHNISAMISNDHLLFNETRLSESTEKLSSGLKLNHARNNPSGMAISIKMKAQIRGLDQAEDNAQDGSSALQIADGALGEMTSIVQRMRELAVQAANDTNTPTDRENLQAEIDSLTDEIDRISDDTEFNSLKLLNGDLDMRGYVKATQGTNSLNVGTLVDTVNVGEGTYTISQTADAQQASFSIKAIQTGSVTINGLAVDMTGSASDVWDQIQIAAERAGTTATFSGTSGTEFEFGESVYISFVSIEYGSDVVLEYSYDSEATAAAQGVTQSTDAEGNTYYETSFVTAGSDVEIELTSGFASNASYSADGQRVTIHGENGFEMIIDLDGLGSGTGTNAINYTIDVVEMGELYLQIGANEGQALRVEIPDVDAYSLGIDYINLCNARGASRAIEKLDDALAKLNEVRASLGAYENRLEHTEKNLETTEENLTAAYSKITDVDMAEEMTTFTNMQILTQAGTSVLAQANELPDQALQMLQ